MGVVLLVVQTARVTERVDAIGCASPERCLGDMTVVTFNVSRVGSLPFGLLGR